MPEHPPQKLIELLERLGLADQRQVRTIGRRVQRLAKRLPLFESVWVDALAQARLLTPYQASEINGGRGERLRVGPYVIEQPLDWPHYVAAYRAREAETREPVGLVVIEDQSGRGRDVLGRLEALASKFGGLAIPGVAPIVAAGADGERRWAASLWIDGRPVADWLVHRGRLPPEVVLEIARQMAATLAAMEGASFCHGDVSTHGLSLTSDGQAVLWQPGVRAIVRPEEGYANADLPPEAYEALAPERVAHGTPPTGLSDLFSCGCVWWHMLTGRPPLAGGSALAKLQAAQTARIADVQRLAPETPASLAGAIAACVSADPAHRPESIARLAAMLGAPTRSGRSAVIRCLAGTGLSAARWVQTSRRARRPSNAPFWLVMGACCLVAVGALFGPRWRPGKTAANVASAAPTAAQDDQVARAVPPAVKQPIPPVAKEVVAASFEKPSESDPQDLVLPAGKEVPAETLKLRAGMRLRSTPGQRARIAVPAAGWEISVEDVRFENVDFVARPKENGAGQRDPVLLRLQAGRAEFRRCCFAAAGKSGPRPTAIVWNHPAQRNGSPLELPTGRLRLSDCVLADVGQGVDCRTIGAVGVELNNTLYLGPGPLVRFDHCPAADEPIVLTLSHVTLRGSGPLVAWDCAEILPQPGSITVRANECTLAIEPAAALLVFAGPQSPERLLERVQWTGQGSLIATKSAVAAWLPPQGRLKLLDDSAVAIAGLVRSDVEFAGSAESGPAANQTVRWQVPLRSPDAPGVDPDELPH